MRSPVTRIKEINIRKLRDEDKGNGGRWEGALEGLEATILALGVVPRPTPNITAMMARPMIPTTMAAPVRLVAMGDGGLGETDDLHAEVRVSQEGRSEGD